MWFLFLALGLVIGSFINVCIYRIPKEQSILYPPSTCPNCHNEIKWYDLIPVLSYIMLKGKCRHCKEKISIRYPLIEIFTATIFILIYIKFNISYITIKYLVLIIFLEIIAFIDLENMEFSSILSYLAIFTGILLSLGEIILLGSSIKEYILGGIIPSGLMYIIAKITKGFGEGDVDALIIVGVFMGLKLGLIALFLSIVIGGAIAVVIILRKNHEKAMAFVPCIFLGTLVAIFYGSNIIYLLQSIPFMLGIVQ